MCMVELCILILLSICSSSKGRYVAGTKANTCAFGEFRCESDGSCLQFDVWCNGRAECKDGSDEKDCQSTTVTEVYYTWPYYTDTEEYITCETYEFLCESDGSCIDGVLRCDGKAECNDGSDEKDCPRKCSEVNCQQECVNTVSGPRCYCNHGFELDGKDNRTCIDIDECLHKKACGDQNKCINTMGYYICQCYDGFYKVSTGDCVKFDVEDSELIFFNEGYSAYIMKRKDGIERVDKLPYIQTRITGLSFQPKTQILYISEDGFPSIYAVDLSSLKQWSLVRNQTSSPMDVEFDWMSNNLYWVDPGKGTIEVISVDTRKRIVLVDYLSKPVSLAISPYRGHMFVSEIGFEGRVSMYGMDGKNRKILHSVKGFPMSLALHPSETLLFWSDPRLGIISYVNYTKESPPVIPIRHVSGVMSVTLSEDKIFYTAGNISLQADGKSSPLGKVHEIKLIPTPGRNDEFWKTITYSHRMKPSGKSECLIDNGGCSYLCLTSPNGRTCACSSAMTLDKDGKSCLGKKCEGNFYRCSDGQCIPSRMKCDFNVDCNDGSDEQDCENWMSH